MRSSAIREKMRELVSTAQKRRARASRNAIARRRMAVSNELELMEKRVLYAAFYAGDIVVERAGDGTVGLTNAAAPIFLDEYNPITGKLVQSIPLPTTNSGTGSTPNAVTVAGSSVEGFLSLTSDGRYLVVPGYADPSNSPAVANTATNGSYGITNTSSATPVIISTGTSTSGGASIITTGTAVTVSGDPNVPAGVYYAKSLTTTTFSLYNNSAMTIATAPLTGSLQLGGTFTTSAVVRDIARIGSDGSVDTTTTLGSTALSTYNIRSVASPDGNTIYYGGSGSPGNSLGVVTFGTSTPSFFNATNTRSLGIYNGQLYVASSSAAVTGLGIGLNTVGSMLPAAGTTPMMANLFNSSASSPSDSSPYSFFFATLNGGTSPDTLYIEDSSRGLFKFDYRGGSGGLPLGNTGSGGAGTGWYLDANVNTSTGAYALPGDGITGSVSGSKVTLYITTPNAIYSVVDNTGYQGNITSSSVITKLASNTLTGTEAFRGIAFVPQPAGAASVGLNPPATTNAVVGASVTHRGSSLWYRCIDAMAGQH